MEQLFVGITGLSKGIHVILIVVSRTIRWELVCQKQVSRTGTSSYISQYLWDVIEYNWPCPSCFWHTCPHLMACYNCICPLWHYNDVIMSTMESQITSLTIIYSTVYSGAEKRKHQSSATLAFVRRIHRSPVNSPHKGPVTRWRHHKFGTQYVT